MQITLADLHDDSGQAALQAFPWTGQVGLPACVDELVTTRRMVAAP